MLEKLRERFADLASVRFWMTMGEPTASKQALGKTGARRQSDLVRLAARFAVRLRWAWKVPSAQDDLDRTGGEDLGSVFSGSLVTSGQGVAEVITTGSRTALDGIGKALAAASSIAAQVSTLELQRWLVSAVGRDLRQ